MRARESGEAAVSEIVGALLLVLVVSSAAFSFGIFLHHQAKETQAQQAAEMAVKLERVVVQGVVPRPSPDGCGGTSATWANLTFTLASRHLHDSTITLVTLNKLAVKTLELAPFNGTNVVDFSLDPSAAGYRPLVVPAGQSLKVMLANASCAARSPFFDPPPAGIPADAPLQFEFATALGNHVERVFIPPVAIATLEPTPGLNSSYVLVGTASQAASEGGFIVNWRWDVRYNSTAGAAAVADCLPASYPSGPTLGTGSRRQVQVTAGAGWKYCARLVVTDNSGLTGETTIWFSP